MTLAESKKLKRGDLVSVNIGNGWIRVMAFKGLYQVTSYGTVTLSTIDKIDFHNGKTEWMANCEWEDEGRKREGYFRPRALKLA